VADLAARFMNQAKPRPVILGGYVNGLGLARSFAAAGMSPIVVDHAPNLAFFSRFVEAKLCPHPTHDQEQFLLFMEALGSTLSGPGFILCTNDIWLVPVSRHQHRLQSTFIFPMSSWDVIERAITKSKLYEEAQRVGIPCPRTMYSSSLSELRNISEIIPYPCVLKPSVTIGFLETLGLRGRTVVLETRAEFDALISRIVSYGLETRELVVQEQIPGGAEHLYTITTYSDRAADILGYSTGHKIRQYPPDAGTIVAGCVIDQPVLLELASPLIKALGFHGIANTEFKLDLRDGIFKLIEINPRPGMWNYSAFAAGINLPMLAYEDVVFGTAKFVGGTRRKLFWLRTLDDLANCLYVYRATGYEEHSMSLAAWWQSVRGAKVDAVFSLNDPLPFLVELRDFVCGVFRTVWRKVAVRCETAFAKRR